jgi:FKBP-type peptidyl-prolyl cis-trans isomerase
MNFFSILSQIRASDSSTAPATAVGAATTSDDSKKHLGDITQHAGILLKTLRPGDITNYPQKGDRCTIHYDAYTEDDLYGGSENPVPFDSSRKRRQAFCFRLGENQVIEGLDVAVSKMSLGEEIEATIPFPYAYGVAGYPPVVPPRATLIFRVELLQISSSA